MLLTEGEVLLADTRFEHPLFFMPAGCAAGAGVSASFIGRHGGHCRRNKARTPFTARRARRIARGDSEEETAAAHQAWSRR